MFEKIRLKDPLNISGMDVYGTCLWHLKKEVELNHLSKDLMLTNKSSCETLCVLGNYHSLMRDHDQAISSFQAAIDTDPDFYYAYTLLGHELLENDETEKSRKAFRGAILKSKLHYNAYFGMALVEKQTERYKLAEYYLRKALEITPHNAVVLDSLAMVVAKDKDRGQEALNILDIILKSDTTGKRRYYIHQAVVLFSLSRYEETREVLEAELERGGGGAVLGLERGNRGETRIFFLLGKTYSRLGRRKEALEMLTLARDYLDHKKDGVVRDEVERLFSQSL